jgi:hypothetical protein
LWKGKYKFKPRKSSNSNLLCSSFLCLHFLIFFITNEWNQLQLSCRRTKLGESTQTKKHPSASKWTSNHILYSVLYSVYVLTKLFSSSPISEIHIFKVALATILCICGLITKKNEKYIALNRLCHVVVVTCCHVV